MRHLLLFIVLLALLPAIVFSQATIQVAPGTNAISAAVANASSGDILELGEGVFIEQNTVVIDKALIIRAKAGLSTKPVWQVEWVVGADSTQLMMKVLDHFWLDGIKLDGKTVAGDTIQSGLLVDKDTKVGQNITLTNCEFVNYLDLAIYAEDSQANNVVIKFCTFAHIPGERGGVGTINWFFDDATTDGSNFSIVNSTIYDTYGRSIYIKANSEMDLLVDHVTIAVDTTGNWGEKTIEYRGVKAIIRNSIITCYPDSANSHGIRLGSAESIVEYIYAGPFVTSRGFWKDKGDFVHPEENILNYDETILTFTDPDNGDFSYPDWQDAYTYGMDKDGNAIPLGDLRPWGLVNAIDDEGIVHVPTKMQLHQNYPNPFNPQTTIGFNLPVAGQVSLTVYNTIGQKIVTLVDQQMKAGQHSVTWNASSVSSGIYFYKIQMDNRVQVRKMVLLK